MKFCERYVRRSFYVAIGVWAVACATMEPQPLDTVPCRPDALEAGVMKRGYTPPSPRSLLLPPNTTFRADSVSRVRLVIDSTGHVMRDSVMVCDITRPTFARTLAGFMAAAVFRPATQDGKPVQSPYVLTLKLGRPR